MVQERLTVEGIQSETAAKITAYCSQKVNDLNETPFDWRLKMPDDFPRKFSGGRGLFIKRLPHDFLPGVAIAAVLRPTGDLALIGPNGNPIREITVGETVGILSDLDQAIANKIEEFNVSPGLEGFFAFEASRLEDANYHWTLRSEISERYQGLLIGNDMTSGLGGNLAIVLGREGKLVYVKRVSGKPMDVPLWKAKKYPLMVHSRVDKTLLQLAAAPIS